MPDQTPGAERPYRVDAEWNRAVFARRTGQVAAFLAPHLRAGMRLLDCGCGPGSIFQPASVYQLPFSDGSFDAAFACAVLQHLAAPLAALKEMRRVLKPGGVIGLVDGSSPIVFRYPTNSLLDKWDRLRSLEREHNAGHPPDALRLRALLREAGFARTQASGEMTTEAGPPAGSLEETRRVAEHHLIRLRGVLGELAVAQGWTTKHELDQIAEAVIAWGEAPDAFYARPAFMAIAWV